METITEDLERLRTALESAMRHVPRQMEKPEGFFTRFIPNPDHSLVSEALAMMPRLIERAQATGLQPIESAPRDGTPIILVNFDARCLLTGAPHVWTARWVAEWEDMKGNVTADENPRFVECSYAATNENGEPTHWMPLPDETEAA